MVRTIHHYVPFTTNVGDLFVRDGIHARLREHFPGAEIVELKANDPGQRADGPVGLSGENLERTNREAQLVIVGGSNMYEGPRWRFKTDMDSLRALRPPLAFIGLGVGSVRAARERPLTPESVEEIQFSHRKALGAAVRDKPTVDFLAGLGLESTLTACPATFVGNRPIKTGKVRRVVISAPPVRFLPKWGHKGFLGGMIMLRSFKRLLAGYQRQGLDWDVIAQDQKDLTYLDGLLAPYGRKPISFGNETEPYYQIFQAADFAICYRLHMAISCLGWGTPFALVNFDKRTAAFRETYAIDAMTFDAFSLRAQRRLRKAVGDAGAMERVATDLFTEVPRRRDQFRETTNQFYQRLAAAVRDGGNTGT